MLYPIILRRTCHNMAFHLFVMSNDLRSLEMIKCIKNYISNLKQPSTIIDFKDTIYNKAVRREIVSYS